MKKLLIALALLAAPVVAQEAKPEAKPDSSSGAPIAAPFRSVTKHSGTFGGQTIRYTAIAGEIHLKDADDKPTAAIFTTSYLKDNPEANRPVTFLWNGGPGSGSLWLHMGAFGPKCVDIPNARDDGAPPYPINPNPDSLLDATDIVFIDPVGTGWSKALGKTEAKSFWGVKQDAKAVAEVIRLWLNENGRWNAPKFIGGESYGTSRSAAVIEALNSGYNDVAVNGIILISTILDFGLEAQVEGNEMQFVVTLPSMAAAGWYHDTVANKPATVEAHVEAARQFATGPYLAALVKGAKLEQAERAAVRARFAALTGLSEGFLDRANLRVSPDRFYKELLRDRGVSIGRLDARYTGKDYDNAGEGPDNDPSFYGIDASYPAAMNAYARGELGVTLDRSYISIGGTPGGDWRIGAGRDAYLNLTPWIGKAMRENTAMGVFIGQGWYDFATPFFAAEYSLQRPGIPQDRLDFQYYQSGHMMYVQASDRTKLSTDIRRFIARYK
ncbi:peptidase S10 [Polymorphobacter multimanifer]|uniref:S10 family peptidase n=1 Tax=Polymorphobacter multimanifer TaxID=1070431 RepID=UPI00166D073D|nr:peptidase S10 [Polymorphobacter multimanifer]GGI82717.1 peptidase S10 [Polymorphobacter multimanifer]